MNPAPAIQSLLVQAQTRIRSRSRAPIVALCLGMPGCHASESIDRNDSDTADIVDTIAPTDTELDPDESGTPRDDGASASVDTTLDDVVDATSTDSEQDTNTPPAPLEQALEAAGFRTEQGAVFSFRTTDCSGLSSCFFANPTSPYLIFGLPRRADSASPVDQPFDSADRRITVDTAWRIAPNEVVIVAGSTPPESAYFSFAHYVYSRFGPDGVATIFGPLGDALNQQTLARTVPSPFNAPFAIVLGSDETLLRAAETAIVTAEPDVAVDRLALDPTHVRIGLSATSDTFTLLGRIALFAYETAGEAWLADPAISIYRATFEDTYEPRVTEREPFTVPLAEPIEAVTSEDVDSAESATRAALSGYQFQILTFPSLHYFDVHTEQARCLPELINCQGMVGDTVYARTDWRPVEDDQVLVAVGVNHEVSGKATYSSVAAVVRSTLASTVAFDSRNMPTAAATLGVEGPNADALFVVAFARSCEGVTIPCQVLADVTPGDEVALLFRAYLEPGSGVAPAAAALTPPRAWRAVPQ